MVNDMINKMSASEIENFVADITDRMVYGDMLFDEWMEKMRNVFVEEQAGALRENIHYEITDLNGNRNPYGGRIRMADISKPPRLVTFLDKDNQLVAVWNVNQIARIDAIPDDIEGPTYFPADKEG